MNTNLDPTSVSLSLYQTDKFYVEFAFSFTWLRHAGPVYCSVLYGFDLNYLEKKRIVMLLSFVQILTVKC